MQVGFFISGSTLILNDYFDLETDKINAPNRPLPSGMINSRLVIFLFVSTALIGLLASFFISFLALAVAIVFWTIRFLYNWKLKRTGLLGKLLVSSSVGHYFYFRGNCGGKPLECGEYARFIYLGATLGLVVLLLAILI